MNDISEPLQEAKAEADALVDIMSDVQSLPRTPTEGKRLIPLILGLTAGVISVIFAPAQASREFYVVCAEVIPVLLLAVALEARLLRLDPSGRGDVESLRSLVDSAVARLRRGEQALARADAIVGEETTMSTRKKLADTRDELQRKKTEIDKLARSYRRLRGLYVGTAASVLLIGEAKALDVIAREVYASANASIVFAVVVFGFAAVLVTAIQGPLSSFTPE